MSGFHVGVDIQNVNSYAYALPTGEHVHVATPVLLVTCVFGSSLTSTVRGSDSHTQCIEVTLASIQGGVELVRPRL